VAYCPQCGAALDPSWQFCARCSTPFATPSAVATVTGAGPTTAGTTAVLPVTTGVRRAAVLREAPAPGWVVAMLATGAAAGLSLASLVPSYLQGGSSLSSSNVNVWYCAPAIVCWALAFVLLVMPRTRRVGAGLAAGVALVWFAALLPYIGLVAKGAVKPGAGFTLQMAGTACGLIAAVAALRYEVRSGGGPSAHRGAAFWAVLLGAVGIAWGIGNAMSWVQYRAHATATGYTYISTGTATITHQCCKLSTHHGWSLTSQLLMMGLAVVIPVVAVLWRPTGFGVAAVIGAAFALVALPLSTVIRLRGSAATNMGVTPAQIKRGGLHLSQHAMPGLWLVLLATAVLAILALGRALQTGPAD
jgi:hypothetical protein